MNISNLLTIKTVFFVFLLLLLISCGGEQEEEALPYNAQQLLMDRQEKQAYFLTEADSPYTYEDKLARTKLSFFNPDSSYVVRAVLSPAPTKDTIVFRTTNDTVNKEMKLLGKMIFALNGEERSLNAYVPMRSLKENPEGPHELFIPFTDNSNGEETYGAGRYMNLMLSEDSQHVLDFNTAYNPYCAYSDGWSCPIVPKENHLDTKVLAGEKDFVKAEKAEEVSSDAEKESSESGEKDN